MKNVEYINAGAGSGKTYSLTKELTELIKNRDVEPEQVILTTFTTKAADEFKEKAKAKLYENGLYDKASRLDQAMIGTVHSVCQRMIAKYWFYLGLSPDMGVMSEDDSVFYDSQSLADLPEDGELKILHDFAENIGIKKIESNGIDYDFWQKPLKSIIGFATNYGIDDFEHSKEESLKYIGQFVKSTKLIEITEKEVENMVYEAKLAVDKNNRLKNKDSYNDKFKDIQKSFKSKGKTVTWMKNVNKNIKSQYGNTCADVLKKLEGIWTSKEVYNIEKEYIELMFALAKRWKDGFAQFKRDKNLLDYNDMEKYMWQLLNEHDDVKEEIGSTYRYLFVDEFQDSSPIQVRIFDALSNVMKKSYWVGDYKQAIYGFRGSDVAMIKAVVDSMTGNKNGCSTRTLDKSWRSLPDIVDVDNNVFSQTFSGILDEKNICLNKNRENDDKIKSLRYFRSGDDGVAPYVNRLLTEKGAKPEEIGILALRNKTLEDVSESLREYGIISSREDIPVVDSKTCVLIESLLRIVNSSRDQLAKAQVTMLTEKDFTTQKLIEKKLLAEENSESNVDEFLGDVALIKKLLMIKLVLRQQSVAAMIESMIIELGLYDIVKQIEDDGAYGISCLQTVIATAKTYEEHCVQMNLPVSIDGFIAYLEAVQPKGIGNPDGVQLHTYHSSKGLQWKYVILMSLNTDVMDVDDTIKKELMGVHTAHSEAPSADNLYPDVYVRLVPWIYGHGNTKVPGDIKEQVTQGDVYKNIYAAKKEEYNRLLYVGMTRPKDVMILDIENSDKKKSPLKWAKDLNLNGISDDAGNGDWDVFGTNNVFIDVTMTKLQIESQKRYKEGNDKLLKRLDLPEQNFEKHEPRYLSPSKIHGITKIISNGSIGKRILFADKPNDMAVVGNCIHQIFAGIDDSSDYDIKEIIKSYGLANVLVDVSEIKQAWQNLNDWLTEKYGKVVKTYHERPFRIEKDDQVIIGSMDYVWQTSKGCVLVDFKTNPMKSEDILDEKSEHYAGHYAGQLDAYTDALNADNENVIARYVFYPVSGLLVYFSTGKPSASQAMMPPFISAT